MEKYSAYTLTLLIGLLLFSCHGNKDDSQTQSSKNQTSTVTTSEDSFLIGTYSGILGCGLSECSGDPGTLILNADHVYTKEKICPQHEKHIEEMGSWIYDKESSRLTLAPGIKGRASSIYRVEPDKLILLDNDGNERKEATPDHYVLHKK